MRTLASIVALSVILTGSADGQWLNHPTPGIPRLPDGTPNLSAPAPRTPDGRPDISGVWAVACGLYGRDACFLQSPFFDLARDLPAGDVEMTPWAAAIQTQREQRNHVDDPYGYCLPPGVPRINFGGGAFKILQTPQVTAFLHETLVGMIFRQAFTDGRPLPRVQEPTWLGYSIGRWDGDTFVVDSTGFKDRGWLDTLKGRPHSDALRVTERFRRLDVGRLELAITIDDPKAFVKPWTVTKVLNLQPDTELLEAFCDGHTKTMEHREIAPPPPEPPSPPSISGPIQGPGPSYPNPSINIVPGAARVEDFPYITEEYFVSGTANGGPYTTRMIVRRPANAGSFSGIVVAEALHAGGRSLVFEWSRVSILTRNHVFVEIVHSPANIALLKAFNAERYASLNISMGQTNEIIAQLGRLVKGGGGPLASYKVRYATLMGTSASSGTVRNYLQDHPKLRMADGGPIFDGFLLTSTNGNAPLPIVDVPMIQMPTQTEVVTWAEMGIAYRRPDSDAPGNRFRLYEVAGMPHNNSRESPAFANDPCTLPVTDFPAGAFTALALNHLVDWIAKGKTPPRAPYIAVDRNPANDGSHLALDEHGNAKGGIRNVWVDVPIATYGVFGKGKTQAQDRLCMLAGTEVPLSGATLRKLYTGTSQYVDRVDRRLKELVAEGWFLPEYVDMVRGDAKASGIP